MTRYSLVLLLCLASLFNASSSASNAESELTPVEIINGQAVIYLDTEMQQKSGLKTQQFQTTQLLAEKAVYGKAISTRPLLSIQSQYQSLLAKKMGAKARLSKSSLAVIRLRRLQKNEAVSIRKLQIQESQWQIDKALFEQLVYESDLIISNSQLKWGVLITQWITQNNSAQFKNLISGKSTLLIITVPAGSTKLDHFKSIFISPTGNRKTAFKASFISLLPSTDNFSQGLQYSFLTDNRTIKPGMNFTAWVPQQKDSLIGITIPETAVAWHLGQAFVFIKTSDEQFIHHNISPLIKVPNGYFISAELNDNEEIVVKGTQMLLSYEFRSQIPSEENDDEEDND